MNHSQDNVKISQVKSKEGQSNFFVVVKFNCSEESSKIDLVL